MSKDKKGVFGLFEKAAGSKKLIFAVLGAFAGIMLLILPGGEKTEPTVSESNETAADYCLLLEEKAEELIKELSGVKDCRVVITLSEGYRRIYATDQHVRETSEPGSGSKQTDKTVAFAESGGNKTPTLVSESMPSVAGVAVVCRGASYETQYKIIELMCALFDIKSNRISVQS